jgi:hypothetical protein
MRRPARDGFWRQRIRGVASLVLLTVLVVATATVIAAVTLAVMP